MEALRTTGAVAFLLAAPLALTCGCLAPPPLRPQVVEPIETPTASGSSAVDLVVGADGHMYLSWIEPSRTAGHLLRFSVWSDGGWTEPRTIASGDDWFVNWADVPTIAALPDGTLAAHWRVKSASATYAYDVLLSVSRDGGASWSDPLRPHRDGTPTEHGFVSLLPATHDAFSVVWLDGRRTAESPPGPLTLRQATLASDGTISASRLLDDRVCDCCSTDSVITASGRTVIAYRDRGAEEVRDISVILVADGAPSAPRSVHEDGWRIAGCPVNGPALAVSGERVGCAWFTMAADAPEGAVRLAFSDDGGLTFGEPLALDLGAPEGRVDLIFEEDGSAAVSWIERHEGAAAIAVRHVSPRGDVSPAILATATSLSRASGFPHLARHRGRTFLAWTESVGASTRVRTGVLPERPRSRAP